MRARVPRLGEGDGGHGGDVTRIDHADPRVGGVGVEGSRRVDRGDRRLRDVLQEQIGAHDDVRETGVLRVSVARGVRADELRVGLPLSAEDRTAHQQLHLGPAGGVDGVAMPADRLFVRAGEQEDLLDSRHRGDQ
jgi:hypothetical protein